MWLRHSHSLHHQSAFVVFICLPSDTDSIPHPSAFAAPLSKCLADWGGGEERTSRMKAASHSYSPMCRKVFKRYAAIPCHGRSPRLREPGLGARLGLGSLWRSQFCCIPPHPSFLSPTLTLVFSLRHSGGSQISS